MTTDQDPAALARQGGNVSALVKHGLDWCIYALDQMRADGTWLPSTERWIEETAAARAELAALRKRVEDAETLLRLALNGGIQDRGDGTFFCWSQRLPDPHDILPKGMDGLPVLTDAARKALGGRE